MPNRLLREGFVDSESAGSYESALDVVPHSRADGTMFGDKLDCDRFKYHKRRARRFKRLDSMTTLQWRRVVNYFGSRCGYCNRRLESRLVAEHVKPLARGGDHIAQNVVPACNDCNHDKRDDDIIQWMLRRASNG